MKSAAIHVVCACVAAAVCSAGARAQEGPERVFRQPGPVTMAELAKRTTSGVSAVEVTRLRARPLHGRADPQSAARRHERQEGRRRLLERPSPAVHLQPRSQLLPAAGVAQRRRHVQPVLRRQPGRCRTVQQHGAQGAEQFRGHHRERAATRLGAVDLFLRQHERRHAAPVARDGGLLRLSQRTGPAPHELRESHAERSRRLQHATGRAVRRGAGRVSSSRTCSRATRSRETTTRTPCSTCTAIGGTTSTGTSRARSGVAATMPRWRPSRGRRVVPWCCRSARDCSSPCSARPAVFRRRRTS